MTLGMPIGIAKGLKEYHFYFSQNTVYSYSYY